jgi:threonine synthase
VYNVASRIQSATKTWRVGLEPSRNAAWQSHAVELECSRCGRLYALERPWNLCACGAPLSTRYDLQAVRRSVTPADIASRPPDLWRYRELLPVQRHTSRICLGEGMTPLLELPRVAAGLASTEGPRRVLLKDESFNPTNSFKARGMAVAVSRALELGLSGMRATVLVPRDTPRAFTDECLACGAQVEWVDGLIDACGRRVAAGRESEGWFDMSTLKEPYRLEGKKTLGYELAEQLQWQLPDVILYPTGGGTGLIGMWKAFDEMLQLGWIAPPLPRLVSVQSSGCAPIVRAFHRGDETAAPWEEARTFALGLRVPVAVADFLMLRALRQSGGTAVAVTDEEMATAGRQLATEEGIFASPEGAATVAALRQLAESPVLQGARTIVLFNTGGWYKYAEGWRAALGFA